MKKLYIFVDRPEKAIYLASIAVSKLYSEYLKNHLKKLDPKIKLKDLAWSNTPFEIGKVFLLEGTSDLHFFSAFRLHRPYINI